MGLFDKLKSGVKISSGNNNDKAGRYWQRIDKIEELESRDGKDYVKISKTTIRVVDGENTVGEETTQALFRDKFDYLEKDLMKIAQAVYGMTTEEANDLSTEKLGEILLGDGPVGEVVQVTVKEMLKKNGEPFAKVYWDHRVTPKALEEGLDEATKAQFFPKGVAV